MIIPIIEGQSISLILNQLAGGQKSACSYIDNDSIINSNINININSQLAGGFSYPVKKQTSGFGVLAWGCPHIYSKANNQNRRLSGIFGVSVIDK